MRVVDRCQRFVVDRGSEGWRVPCRPFLQSSSSSLCTYLSVCLCVCVWREFSSCVYVCVCTYIIPWATRVPCVPRVDWFTNSGCSCVPCCCLSDAEHYDPCCVVSAFFDLDSRYCRAVDVGMFHCLFVVTVAVFWAWLIRRLASLWRRNRRLSVVHATATAVVNQCVVCALHVAVDWWFRHSFRKLLFPAVSAYFWTFGSISVSTQGLMTIRFKLTIGGFNVVCWLVLVSLVNRF